MTPDTLRAIVADSTKEIEAALEQVRIAAHACAQAQGLRLTDINVDVNTMVHSDLITPQGEVFLTGVQINVRMGL